MNLNSNMSCTFCYDMPKIELHAHLNGSLSQKTLMHLIKNKPHTNVNSAESVIMKGGQRTMAEGFELFRLIHKLVDSSDDVKFVTKSVISEFYRDNVKYLELRSTPKDIKETSLSKALYIQSVLQAIKEYQHENPNHDIDVVYLPSIDRGRTLEDAAETLKLVNEIHTSGGSIPAIDFSGNPYTLDCDKFLPILNSARNNGLKLAVHLCEISDRTNETRELLSVFPDRIGHGTYLMESTELTETVRSRRTPIEICLTSNMKTSTCPPDAAKHHIADWYFAKPTEPHPCALCTDDKGVFSTNLSNEFDILSNAMNMDKNELFNFSRNSIAYAFCDHNNKKHLYQLFDKWMQDHNNISN